MITSLNTTVLMKKTVLKGNGLKNGDTNIGWNKNGLNTGEGINGVKVKNGDGIRGLNTNGSKNAEKGWKRNGLGKKKLNEKLKTLFFDTILSFTKPCSESIEFVFCFIESLTGFFDEGGNSLIKVFEVTRLRSRFKSFFGSD